MKSLYQDRKFATYWNKRAGKTGEIYKRLILDPIMLDLIGSLDKKVIIDLGCGNGYLAPKFISHSPKSLLMADISGHNLENAKEKCDDKRISYLEQDMTKRWKVDSGSVDVVYSNMMLNEVENIKTPIEEAYRVLKNNSTFIFSVTHPSWDLFVFAQEQVGKKSKKMQGLGNYFRRGYAKYIMGADSKTNPELSKQYEEEFEIDHYQRPLSDYFNQLTVAGFSVKKIIEPELTKQLLKESPRFSEYKDHPIGLIFYAIK
ncbi:MAG: class I SAM-dependent methyltransferase [Candidatus Berkelbacteria bacterium]|nr:class I SAM-dependent methyltransferase [Candidatus Berkelbacteria bacterium]